MNQKGLSSILIVLVIITVIAIGGLYSLLESRRIDYVTKPSPAPIEILQPTPQPSLSPITNTSDDNTQICSNPSTGVRLKLSEALDIAQKSDCTTIGSLTQSSLCDEFSGTWWINIDTKEKKSGCNPACGINPNTKKAAVNWRCTGAIPSNP